MKDLVSDVWNDLREKRLWPVAVLLVVALVAVPLVLAKGAEEPAAPPPAPQAQQDDRAEQATALANVELEDEAVGDGSSLDTFDASDPFSPPARVVEKAEEEAEGDAPVEVAPGTDGGGAPVVDDTVNVDVQEGGSNGGSDDTDGDGTGGDQDGGETKTKTTEYAYVLDVTFWKNDDKRRVKGLQKLDMLPNAASPLLIYMGVTKNAGNAVFMVDATLQTTGEGRCKPSAADCAFLYLGAGSEQEFTDADGNSYRLEIDQIRRVKVGKDSASSSKKRKRPHASAAVGAPRRFVLPLLADLVSVSTTTDPASGSSGGRR